MSTGINTAFSRHIAESMKIEKLSEELLRNGYKKLSEPNTEGQIFVRIESNH